MRLHSRRRPPTRVGPAQAGPRPAFQADHQPESAPRRRGHATNRFRPPLASSWLTDPRVSAKRLTSILSRFYPNVPTRPDPHKLRTYVHEKSGGTHNDIDRSSSACSSPGSRNPGTSTPLGRRTEPNRSERSSSAHPEKTSKNPKLLEHDLQAIAEHRARFRRGKKFSRKPKRPESPKHPTTLISAGQAVAIARSYRWPPDLSWR